VYSSLQQYHGGLAAEISDFVTLFCRRCTDNFASVCGHIPGTAAAASGATSAADDPKFIIQQRVQGTTSATMSIFNIDLS
jgi:hypothetical protein